MDIIKAGERIDFLTMLKLKEDVKNAPYMSYIQSDYCNLKTLKRDELTEDMTYNNSDTNEIILPIDSDSTEVYFVFSVLRLESETEAYFDTVEATRKGITITSPPLFHIRIPILDKKLFSSYNGSNITEILKTDLEVAVYGYNDTSANFMVNFKLNKNPLFPDSAVRSNIISFVRSDKESIGFLMGIEEDDTNIRKLSLSDYNNIITPSVRVNQSKHRKDYYNNASYNQEGLNYRFKDTNHTKASLYHLGEIEDITGYDTIKITDSLGNLIIEEPLDGQQLFDNEDGYYLSLLDGDFGRRIYVELYDSSNPDNRFTNYNTNLVRVLKGTENSDNNTNIYYYKDTNELMKGFIDNNLLNSFMAYGRDKLRPLMHNIGNPENYTILFNFNALGFAPDYYNLRDDTTFSDCNVYEATLDFDNINVISPLGVSSSDAYIYLKFYFPDIFKNPLHIKKTIVTKTLT